MARRLLGRNAVAKLIDLLDELFDMHAQHRASDELASLIQYPKIPAILSESAVAWLIRDGKIPGVVGRAEMSMTGGDLDLRTPTGALETIEVKATGRNAFQYFSQTDIDADHLVWLHFGDFFQDARQTTSEIVVISNAAFALGGPQKITLPALKKTAGLEWRSYELDLRNMFPSADA